MVGQMRLLIGWPCLLVFVRCVSIQRAVDFSSFMIRLVAIFLIERGSYEGDGAMNRTRCEFSVTASCLGFTLAELVVVSAIVAVMVYLTAARRSGCQRSDSWMSCSNNAKQIGLGCITITRHSMPCQSMAPALPTKIQTTQMRLNGPTERVSHAGTELLRWTTTVCRTTSDLGHRHQSTGSA